MSKAKEFLEKVMTDRKANELLKIKNVQTNEDEIINAYLDAAKELGYDITGDDLVTAITELENEQKGKTESMASSVSDLPDDALANAAGGAGNNADGYCTKNLWHIGELPAVDNETQCKNLLHKPCNYTFDRSYKDNENLFCGYNENCPSAYYEPRL